MKLASFDVETRGTEEGYALQPFRACTDEAWLTMCAMATDKGVSGFRYPDADPAARRIKTVSSIGPWLRRCAETKTTICGWNTPFDMAWLIALGLRDEVYACNWLDGMMLWRHLTASPEWTGLAPKSYGLKNAVSLFYPAEAGYEQEIDFFTDDPVELDRLFTYNKKDAEFTLRLVNKFLDDMTPEQRRCALLEAACLPMVAETHVEGICVDVEAARSLSDKLSDDAKLNFVKLRLNSNAPVDETILASTQKLRKLLFEDWGLPKIKWTDKGSESTDRDVLSQLAATDHRAALLNAYREAKNNRTKFAEGTIDSAEYNGDGRVRPSAKVYGTYTGRMTYGSKIGRGKSERPTGVALHQWKRDPVFRGLILPPEGHTLLEFDFAGQEFRWMAVLSGDPTMIQLCQPGEDAHAYMGAKVAHWTYDDIREKLEAKDPDAKNKRQLGKVANLSLQYRTSANTLVRVARTGYQMDLKPSEATAIHATYRTTYPLVSRYWKEQIRMAREDGFVETIAKRRVYLGQGHSWKDDDKWGLESTAINFPIQGSGADQKYLALAIAKNYLPTVDGHFYFELHDGLFFVVPDRHADRAVAELKPLLSALPYKRAWGVDLPVEFPVDAKMGKSWGDLKEIK